jgi:hypothetical protein
MFQPLQVFHRPISLKITDLLIQDTTQYAHVDVGAKKVAVYCSVDLLLCVGHIRTVLQAPVMATCLRCVKMGWHQRPKIHRAVALRKP